MTSKLTEESVLEIVGTGGLGSPVEVYPIALTTESVALGWLRQRHAPHGAMVLAEHEVAPRARSGEAIESGTGLAFSVILRPAIAVDHQDILWAMALIAARSGYEAIGGPAKSWWPETLVVGENTVGHVRAETQLAPGAIDSTVLTWRLSMPETMEIGEKLGVVKRTLEKLETMLADTPADVASEYVRSCALNGQPIRVELRPSGASGGTAVSVDERGGFGVAASSGSVTRHGVDQIREIKVRA